MIGRHVIGLKFDVSFSFFSSFNIKHVLPFVIHSDVLLFSRHLFKCVIIFSQIFVNPLIQNPQTLPGLHTFHFGSLRNCCLNLTASIMVSSCFLLLLTLSLTSLIHSALLLCPTFWNQILLQNFLLSSTLGFTLFCLLFSSVFSNKGFCWLSNNLLCTNYFFHHTSEAWRF